MGDLENKAMTMQVNGFRDPFVRLSDAVDALRRLDAFTSHTRDCALSGWRGAPPADTECTCGLYQARVWQDD